MLYSPQMRLKNFLHSKTSVTHEQRMMLAGFITIFLFVTVFFLLTSALLHDVQVRMIAISRTARALIRATPPKPERYIVAPHITDAEIATTVTPAITEDVTMPEEPKPELRRGFHIMTTPDGEMKLEPLGGDVASLGTITIPSFALLALRLSGEAITSASIPLGSDRVTAYLSTAKNGTTKIYAVDIQTKKASVIKTINDANGIVYATYGISGNHLVLVNTADQNLESAMILDLGNPSGALARYETDK